MYLTFCRPHWLWCTGVWVGWAGRSWVGREKRRFRWDMILELSFMADDLLLISVINKGIRHFFFCSGPSGFENVSLSPMTISPFQDLKIISCFVKHLCSYLWCVVLRLFCSVFLGVVNGKTESSWFCFTKSYQHISFIEYWWYWQINHHTEFNLLILWCFYGIAQFIVTINRFFKFQGLHNH